MKNVTIKNKQGEILSDQNLYEDPTEFINHIVSTNYWGKPERWVRAKKAVPSDPDDGAVYTAYPDEQYDDGDVIELRTDEVDGEFVHMVKLKAEYTIEISDYNPVPYEISRAQLKLALLQFGMLDDAEALVNHEDTPKSIKIEWADRLTFKRDNENLNYFAGLLGLASYQVDELFRMGSTL
jgi:hypothetical protein